MELLKENIEGLRKINKLPQRLKDFLHETKVQHALIDEDIGKLYELYNSYNSNLTRLLYTIGIDPLSLLDYIPNNFLNYSTIKSIVIPDNIIKIGRNAFGNCTNLTNVVIGNSVVFIGEGAFNECTNLTNVIISTNVTDIGSMAFAYCDQLTNINYKGTKSDWSKIRKHSFWDHNSGIGIIHCTDGDIKALWRY